MTELERQIAEQLRRNYLPSLALSIGVVVVSVTVWAYILRFVRVL